MAPRRAREAGGRRLHAVRALLAGLCPGIAAAQRRRQVRSGELVAARWAEIPGEHVAELTGGGGPVVRWLGMMWADRRLCARDGSKAGCRRRGGETTGIGEKELTGGCVLWQAE
jgi:hypothetical protein